jgi:hypothetical protein
MFDARKEGSHIFDLFLARIVIEGHDQLGRAATQLTQSVEPPLDETGRC